METLSDKIFYSFFIIVVDSAPMLWSVLVQCRITAEGRAAQFYSVESIHSILDYPLMKAINLHTFLYADLAIFCVFCCALPDT